MSEFPPKSEERVVITASDVAQAGAAPSSPPAPSASPIPPPAAYEVPWWAVLLASCLAICLPLLCLFAIGIRVGIRRRDVRTQAAWNGLLCTLLIVSGLLTSVAVTYTLTLRPKSSGGPVEVRLGALRSLDGIEPLPSLPAPHPMSTVELAARTKPLVFIVTPDSFGAFHPDSLETASLGAGTLLYADNDGYLVGTNRHVVDERGLFHLRPSADRVRVVTSDGNYADGQVVGRHSRLDLAILWVARKSGHGSFRQPVSSYSDVPVGQQVFVIGHPQRLFFTLSNGLVSRLDGTDLLQLSAPISPGNSGGPVYDSSGVLLGIVTYKVDKQSSPNAENLNFATRADAFLSESGWDFYNQGSGRLKRFLDAR
ncbi:MAG TPA: S1C family serine protease [Bryobacteraceae bacterium]|nr:S1C family serine protease [Bryobacteraceae bacterium]